MPQPDLTILTVLRRLQLVDQQTVPPMIPLAGGVSSDIWRVDLPEGAVCVKRALPRLKVHAVWEVPVERNRYEWEWLQVAAAVTPDCVPPLVAQDTDSGCFVMQYLDSDTYPLWKDQLRRGIAKEATARAVGQRLAAIHGATASRSDIRDRFQTDHIFYAIRIEPYLLATAARHDDLAAPLRRLASDTIATKQALVHGDASPKNILIGPRGPIFLDAECAWYGDPVFDLAFCLNHLLLKCLWTRSATNQLLRSFDALAEAYLTVAAWDDRVALERRTARLLPGLFLARIDGKSPVEYITEDADQALVRHVARELLLQPVATIRDVRKTWAKALERTR